MAEHNEARTTDSRDRLTAMGDTEVRGSRLGDGGAGSRQLADMPSSNAGSATRRSTRGFASMDPQRQKEIASKGGRAAHRKGTAHQWSVEEARVAGRKGGTSVSRDREHMAAIGREGGASAHRRARQASEDEGNRHQSR
jgi:general stress protein YciG